MPCTSHLFVDRQYPLIIVKAKERQHFKAKTHLAGLSLTILSSIFFTTSQEVTAKHISLEKNIY